MPPPKLTAVECTPPKGPFSIVNSSFCLATLYNVQYFNAYNKQTIFGTMQNTTGICPNARFKGLSGTNLSFNALQPDQLKITIITRDCHKAIPFGSSKLYKFVITTFFGL